MEFNPQELERIAQSIRNAEMATTGEIRVHIEERCELDPLKRAKAVFKKLGMDRTKQRNGVLVYIASADRKAAIFGDAAIASQVPESFWDDEFDILRSEFSQGRYSEGLCRVVEEVGAKLKALFPSTDDTPNPDELKNDVSFGSEAG